MHFKTLSKLALAAALSFGASAFAADEAAAAPMEKAAPAASAAKAPKAKSFSGTVVSSDAIANTLVVKGGKGEETFSVAPTAKIVQGKKDVKIADVMKDEKVTVKYTEENGAKTASMIRVSAAKKEAKTAAASAQ
ncbi:MAG TPA: hypothetical protein VJ385_16990 [Fibrobacteria bacterium]|nr:hypothetical protein [Fibrobacteria bacterium]